MADEIKTTLATYELHIGDKVVSKDGRHGKIVEVTQTTPLNYDIVVSFMDDKPHDDKLDIDNFVRTIIIDFNKATEKSLKDCCPDLYRINGIVFGNRLTADEIQRTITAAIEAKKEQLENLKKDIDYLRKREWRLTYQMPEPTYGTPIDSEDTDE